MRYLLLFGLLLVIASCAQAQDTSDETAMQLELQGDSVGTEANLAGEAAGSSWCNETDGGKVFDVAGRTLFGTGYHVYEYADRCRSSSVIEYYCVGSRPARTVHACEGACLEGACVAPNATPSGVWDVDANGRMDATDAQLVASYLFGVRSLGGAETRIAALERAGALDVDGNGRQDALTDGVLLGRFLQGTCGAALVDGARPSDSPRSTGEIVGHLRCREDACLTGVPLPLEWDMDASGRVDAADAQLVLGYLFGAVPNMTNVTASHLAAFDAAGRFDLDGDGRADALTDGVLLSRWVAGECGAGLLDGALAAGASARTEDAVLARIYG